MNMYTMYIDNITTINALRKNKILNQLKLKALADDKINVTKELKFVLVIVEDIFWKRRKCW